MRTNIWTALPLAAALSLPLIVAIAPTPASAQASSPSREIVVTASPREVALSNWASRVQSNLERKMRMTRVGSDSLYDEDGLAQVRFECSNSGKPGQITLAKSSGNNRIDRAALRAVERLPSLHPMPEGMKPNQKILAQMLFINSPGSERDIAQRVKTLKKDATAHNAWFYRDDIASGEVLFLSAAR